MSEQDRSKADPAVDPGGKKRYTTPKLQEYGHVAKLTQGGGSTRVEPNNPVRRPGPQCL